MEARRKVWWARVASTSVAAAIVVLALAPVAAIGKPEALDHSFGENGRVVTKTELGGRSWLDARVHIAGGPNGTIVAAVGKAVFRYLPEGSLDTSFGEGGKLTVTDPEGLPFTPHDLAVDGEGRIVLAGAVELPDRILVNYLGSTIHGPLAAAIRYSADGTLDTSFGEKGGYVLSELNQPPLNSYYGKAATSAEEVIVDPEGSLTLIGGLGGYTTGIRSEYRMVPRLVARLTAGGRLDTSFGDGGVIGETGLDGMSAIAPYGDELLLSGRRMTDTRAPWSEALTRLHPDGSTDRSFGRDGRSAGLFAPPLTDLAVDRLGRTAVLGGRSVLRLTRRGTRDRHFGYRGGVTVRLPGASKLSSLAVHGSGDMLLTGTQAVRKLRRSKGLAKDHDYRRSFTVIALDPRGKPDRRFGRGGWLATRFGRRSSALASEAFIDRSGLLVVGGTVATPDLAPTGGIALARYRLRR